MLVISFDQIQNVPSMSGRGFVMVLFPVMIDFCVNNIENDRYSIFYFFQPNGYVEYQQTTF